MRERAAACLVGGHRQAQLAGPGLCHPPGRCGRRRTPACRCARTARRRRPARPAGQGDAQGIQAVLDGHGMGGAKGGHPTLASMTLDTGGSHRQLCAGLAAGTGRPAAAGVVAGRPGSAWHWRSASASGGWLSWRRRAGRIGALALCLALAPGGLREPGWRAAQAPGLALAALEGRTQGLVPASSTCRCRRPRGTQGTRFVFRVEQADAEGPAVTRRRSSRLAGTTARDGDSVPARPARRELRAGQRWRFTAGGCASRTAPSTRRFRCRAVAVRAGTQAPPAWRCAPARRRTPGCWPAAGHPVERARQAVRDAIRPRGRRRRRRRAGGAGGGRPGAIDRDDWDLFRVTGVAHLMSISGLHVTHVRLAGRGLVARCGAAARADAGAAQRGALGRAGRGRLAYCWPAGACRRSARCG